MTAEDVDLLQRAATALRDRAEAATSGPWEVIEDVHRGYPEPAREISVWSPSEGRYVTEDVSTVESSLDRWRANARHIATWSPTTALFAADLLDAEARSHHPHGWDATRLNAALTLARSILQEDT